MSIIPTVGRQVWYFGGAENPGEQVPAGVPLAATVAYVHPDGRLNLQVLDSRGIAHSRTTVPLAQDGEPLNGAHAEWPPVDPTPNEFEAPPAQPPAEKKA